MKITALELKDFRNHEKTTLMLEKYNFITGKNNAGKSSIVEGLQFALTGKNLRETSAKSLIRAGEDTAIVEAEIESLGVISRNASSSGQTTVELNGFKIPDREMEKELNEVFGLSYDALNCILHSHEFIRMPSKEQKDFLVQISGFQLTTDKVLSFLETPTPLQKSLAEEELQAGIQTGTVKFDDLDKLHNTFYASRREAKKQLAAIKTKMDSVLGAISNSSSEYYSEAKKELDKIRPRRDEIVGLIAVVEQKRKQREQIEARLLKHRTKLNQLQSQITATDDEIEEIPGMKGRLDASIAERNEAEITRRTLEGKNKTITEMMGRLNTAKCPLNDALICKTDKSVLLSEFKTEFSTNEKIIISTKALIADKDTFISDMKKKISLLETQRTSIQNIRIEIAAISTLEVDLAEITTEDTASLSAELQRANAIINKTTAIEAEHIKDRQLKAEHAILKIQHEEMRTEVGAYEYLVGEFSPDGIKIKILKKIIAPLKGHLDKMLKKFNMGEIDFCFSNGFTINIQTASGMTAISSLSVSEKMRLGIIFQDAFSNLTGARILIIDGSEILDIGNFAMMMEILFGNYDTVFVVGIELFNTAGALPTTPPEKTKIFFVEAGSVTEI